MYWHKLKSRISVYEIVFYFVILLLAFRANVIVSRISVLGNNTCIGPFTVVALLRLLGSLWVLVVLRDTC